MGGAMNAAATGMHVTETELQLVGDNLANMQSVGFKETSGIFGEIYAQTVTGAAAAANGRGGVNPITMGAGATLLGEQINQNQGAITPDGNPTNMAINGAGFFVLDSGGGGQVYTRNGACTLKAGGHLAASNGMYVMGYNATNGVLPASGSQVLQDLQIPMNAQGVPAATQKASWTGNLDPNRTTPYTDTGTVFDAQGNAIQMQVKFTPTGSNTWSWTVTGPTGATGSGTVTFTSAGAYSASTGGPISVPGVGGSPSLSITPTLTGLTQFATSTSAVMSSQDGYPAGQPKSLSVSSNGVVAISYNNGQTMTVGQVAMAGFANASGLQGGSQGIFKQSPASGIASIGVANSGGRGAISPDSLEGSNVSLTQQFVTMIQAQHAFEADSQVLNAQGLMDTSLGQVQV